MAWTLTTGRTEALALITGSSSNHFNAANALIGIGDSSTAVSAGQTDLVAATNKTYKGMESGWPTTPASGAVDFKAIFLTSEANYAWNELVVKNSTSGICLLRDITGWSTKTSSEVWYMTLTVAVS